MSVNNKGSHTAVGGITQGRTIDLFNLMEHYMYYMVKPECRDEARLRLYIQLAKRGVIKTQF